MRKRYGTGGDSDLNRVLLADSALDQWRDLAAQWLAARGHLHFFARRGAVVAFLLHYVHAHDLPRSPREFLLAANQQGYPAFADAWPEG